MALPYELLVGLRYTRAKRRNHFISFISMISMLGIALGVAALIVVLSVMNGFQTQQNGTLPLYGQMMAASLVCAAPVIVLFLIFQRYLVSGLTSGAVKG